ncbi:MAG: dockerin type I repeat-containing protein [Phycisphaerales bacterium]
MLMPRTLRWVLTVGVVVALTGSALATPPAYVVGQNFKGSTYLTDTTLNPPDTMGAVGPNHFVELINSRYSVYRKSDGVRVQTSTLDQFFINSGITISGSFSFDPRVIYDKPSGRWFGLAVDAPRAANSFLLAVSNTSDPTQGWQAFKIDSDTDNVQWADFPTLGVSADSVMFSANMFAISSGPFFVHIGSVPKASLLAGNIAGVQLFEDISSSTSGFAVQPVTSVDGAVARPLLSSFNSSSLKRTLFTGAPGALSLDFSTPPEGVPIGNSPPLADQPGPRQNFATIDNRFTGSVVQIGGTSWAVRCVSVPSTAGPSNAGVQWFRLDAATGALLEFGLIADNEGTTDFMFPSIAANTSGDVVIGYSSSNDETRFNSSFASVGRFDGVSTEFNPPQLLRAGVSDFVRLDGSGRNRWGDYSATTLDPEDPRRFWTIQEFVSATDIYSTQITEIIVTPACQGDVDGNGTVDTADLVLVLGIFGLCPTNSGWLPRADLDAADPCINTSDLVVLLGFFGNACP